MRIGEAAALVGVEPHVLRHWEDTGVVKPARNASGYRDYDDETIARLRIVVTCRAAGISLPEIRLLLHSRERGRAAVIRRRRDIVEADIERLGETLRFLNHVIDCRHTLVTRCPGCSQFAATPADMAPRSGGVIVPRDRGSASS